MDYYLGVDLGTSSLKILAATSKGAIIGQTSRAFSIISTQANYSEENPQDWLMAFDRAFTELLEKFPDIKGNLASIAFSGQMHSLVLLDETGEPLRNAILWNDTRTSSEVKSLMSEQLEHLLAVEKNIALDGFTLPKILWIKKHEPQLWAKTWKFMLPKDYLIYYLTGKTYTEWSDASGTIMYDVQRHEWDQKLLDQLGIEREKCPTILKSTDSAGDFKAGIKKKFGITTSVTVIMGGADNACGALGNITDQTSQGLISVGTSGVVLAYTEPEVQTTGRYHYFNSTATEYDYKMGVTLAAGYSLDWFKQTFAPNESFAELTKTAQESPIGSHNVIFLPYLFGERSPYFNAELSGGLIGLKAYHRRSDIVRAVLEGIAFSLRNVYEIMDLKDERIEKFRITGGVVKNELWLQMFADIFNKEIEVLELDEGPAFGALLCGIIGITGKKSVEIWAQYNQVKKSFLPNKAAHLAYQSAFDRFVVQSDLCNKLE